MRASWPPPLPQGWRVTDVVPIAVPAAGAWPAYDTTRAFLRCPHSHRIAEVTGARHAREWLPQFGQARLSRCEDGHQAGTPKLDLIPGGPHHPDTPRDLVWGGPI